MVSVVAGLAGAAGVAAGAGAGVAAVVLAGVAAAGVSSHVATPLWPRQAPRCEVPLNVVPSLHVAIGVPPVSADAGVAVFVAGAGFAALAVDAAGAAGVAGVAADLSSHVCTPL